MIRGFDIDDVMVRCVESFASFNNRMYGTMLCESDFDTYDLHNPCGITPDELNRRLDEFYRSQECQKMLPIEGCIETICALRELGDELHAITARPRKQTEESTLDFFATYFPPRTFATVNFTREDIGWGSAQKKWEVGKRLGIQSMVDDVWNTAYRIGEMGAHSLLYSRPWNQPKAIYNYELPFTRVSDWSQIRAEFEKRRR